MKRTIAIGDVHGCARTLRAMVEDRIGLDRADHLILLGDYIDRGPSSKAVLDYIVGLIELGYSVTPLRGNHDDLLVRARFSTFWHEKWMMNGGATTLCSLGASSPLDVDPHYVNLIEALPLYCHTPQFTCTHASLNMEIEDPFADTYAMMFLRTEGVTRSKIGGRRLLCGHTPQTRERIYHRLECENKVIIDNGCVYAGEPGMGFLCAFDLDSFDLMFVRNIDHD